jgi:rhodanese-related sulfurtransferase
MLNKLKLLLIVAACCGACSYVIAIELPQGKTGKAYEKEAKKQVKAVSCKEVNDMLENNENCVLLDIRSYTEFKEDGWIEGRCVLPHGMALFKIRDIVPDKRAMIVIYCKKGGRSAMVARDLQLMGYENIRYLEGGINVWKRNGYAITKSGSSNIPENAVVEKGDMPEGKTPEEFVEEANAMVKAKTAEEAKEMMDENDACVLLDIRTEKEIVSQGKIAGALVMEYGLVPFKIQKKVHDANTPFLVICEKGGRSAIMAKMLTEMGYHDVHHISGGIMAWEKAGLHLD